MVKINVLLVIKHMNSLLLLLIVFAWKAPVAEVFAQADNELLLRMYRNFGYSSGNGDIQGTFTLKVSGPENLRRVEFYIDRSLLGEVSQPSYQWRFQTGDYNLGVHTLFAHGYTTDGQTIGSNQIRVQFVSAEEGWQAGIRVAVPLLVIVFGLLAISLVLTFLIARKTKNLPLGTPRNYGRTGGAICPECNRPFSRHLLALNLLSGKLERCPFCGKFSIVKAAPLAELRAAEAAELDTASREYSANALNDAQKFRKSLDETRFQDL